MSNRVAILIPIYRTDFNPLEEISLKQLKAVLSAYLVFLVVPESLNTDTIVRETGFNVEKFPDEYFHGIEAYSRLCTSTELYERFSDYEYVLIYQLDAFVFSDRLKEFCELSFDYFGAPIPDRIWPYLDNKVGSGGISLRRIGSCLRVLNDKERIMERMKSIYPEDEIDKTIYLEDRFFAFCGQCEDIDFTVPDIKTAFEFAVEFNVDGIYDRLKENKPFGCHKWYAENFDFWWPIIKEYGYELTDEDIEKWTFSGAEHERWIKCEELADGRHKEELKELILKHTDSDVVCLWGNGDMGKSAQNVLKKLGIQVQTIFDSGTNRFNAVMTVQPTEDNLADCHFPIFICAKNSEKSIMNRLSENGRILGKDYFSWMDIERKLIERFGAE